MFYVYMRFQFIRVEYGEMWGWGCSVLLREHFTVFHLISVTAAWKQDATPTISNFRKKAAFFLMSLEIIEG